MYSSRILLVDDPAVEDVLEPALENLAYATPLVVTWAHYWEKLKRALLEGDADIVMIPGHVWVAELVDHGLIRPIEAAKLHPHYVADLVPNILVESTFEREMWIVPIFTDGHLLFDPCQLVVMTTGNIVQLDQVIDAACHVKENTGVPRWIMKAHVSEILTDFYPYLLALGGRLFDEEMQEPLFREFPEALEWYRKTKQFALRGCEHADNATVASAVSGGVASGLSWGGQAATICRAGAAVRTLALSDSFNATWGLAISRNVRDLEQAYAIINELLLSEVDQQVALHAGSPVRTSTYERLSDQLPWLEAQRSMLDRAVMLPRLKRASTVFPLLSAAIWRAYVGEQGARQALDEAALEIQFVR